MYHYSTLLITFPLEKFLAVVLSTQWLAGILQWQWALQRDLISFRGQSLLCGGWGCVCHCLPGIIQPKGQALGIDVGCLGRSKPPYVHRDRHLFLNGSGGIEGYSRVCVQRTKDVTIHISSPHNHPHPAFAGLFTAPLTLMLPRLRR